MKLINRTGGRYGRLLVLEKIDTPRMWVCLCDCGTRKLVAGSNLANGSIRSCGCLAHEHASAMGSNPDYIAKRAEKAVKHGQKRRGNASSEYKTWLGMKRRCTDTKCKDFPNWGGRGIKVCERWTNSFDAFFADMGPKPSPAHSIDRIDPESGYLPGNCRWANAAEQGDTKRNNIPVDVHGKEFPSVVAACRASGVKRSTAFQRIAAGIDAGLAVTHVGRLKPRRRPGRRR